MSYFLGKIFMVYFWFRWRCALTATRSVATVYKDRGLEDTPVYPYVIGRIHVLESMGIRYKWLREDQRTVTPMPDAHPGFEYFNESGESGIAPPKQKPN
jgi:hypothetical protein